MLSGAQDVVAEGDLAGNHFAQFLQKKGYDVVNVQGTIWYKYKGFMIPAYLPHCTPNITEAMAREVRKQSRAHFVRWHSKLDATSDSAWWYVMHRGPWSIDDVKDKKKRWMIRQGKNHFTVRPLTYAEAKTLCPAVSKAAAKRYNNPDHIENVDIFRKKIAAGETIPDVLEYVGCFHGDKLVSFSENYIQDNAVWLETIRHDPEYLNQYSSYGLMDGLLHYYLNERKMQYVLDGSRNIYHRTDFQDHLIRVFGFQKVYASLHIEYSRSLKSFIHALYPFRKAVFWATNAWITSWGDILMGLLLQEDIRKSFL